MDRNPPAERYESYNLLAGQRMTTAGERIDDLATFSTQPDRIHRVQTETRRTRPSIRALTFWRLGRQTLLVLLFAWLTLFPTNGFLPHIEHILAIAILDESFLR